MNPAQRRATYDDLLKVPDILVAEILDGELFTSPRPALPHARVTSVLRGVLVPDLAGWRRERMPVFSNEAYVELAPDWVCEVVSPSTARVDRVRKVPIYAREGVSHLWLVDPLQHTLEVFRLEGRRWVLISTHGRTETVRAEPFAALELDMRR